MRRAVGLSLCWGMLLVSSGALAAPLISASGLDGAGLGMVYRQTGRAYGELGFHSQSDLDIVVFNAGLGLMPLQHMELSLVFPYSRVSTDDESASAVGNLTLGASYVDVDDTMSRVTAGVLVSLPTSPDSGEDAAASLIGTLPDGLQHPMLRVPGAVGVTIPIHLEAGSAFVGSLDASIEVHQNTEGDDDLVSTATLAPGLGAWVGPAAALGVRFPMLFAITEDTDDRAQLCVEPFVRFDLGAQGFLGLRGTIPIDDPLADLDIWGVHVGGGAAF